MTRAANLAEAAGSGFAFRNKAINGAFDIWQRGTSFAAGVYSADRFYSYGGIAGTTVSQQSFGLTDTLGNDPAPTYFYRYSAATFSGATDVAVIGHRVEDWRQFLGRKLTVSFWYRKPAGVIAGDSILLHLKRSSGFYDNCLELAISAPSATSGSSWAFYSGTFTIPAGAASGQTMTSTASMGITWYYQQCLAAGNIDIANFQIEIGATPTPFERRPYGTELALCQRYYQYDTNFGQPYVHFSPACFLNATGAYAIKIFPVEMRTLPTLTFSAGSTFLTDGATSITPSSIACPGYSNTKTIRISLSFASGGVAGQGFMLASAGSGTALITYSAEL